MTRHSFATLCLLILQSAARPQESFNTTPLPIKSNFTCNGRITGYYADLPSNCRIYHNCDDQGNKFSYYCPEMTAFRQEALICDHAHLVDCQAGTRIGKLIDQSKKTLDQSKSSTSNPFHDFLLNKKNSTFFETRKTRPDDVTAFKFPGTNSFGFNFGDASGTASGSRNNEAPKKQDANQFSRFKETPKNDNRPSFLDRNETRSFEDKETSDQSKTRDDQLTVNSRSHSAWFNHEWNGANNFPGRPEVSDEAKLWDRNVEQRAESTTQISLFKYTQTTNSYFDYRNSNYPWSDKAEVRSTRIPLSTSPKTPTTILPSTSEIPVRDFTASLKPLVPNALEYDPYYPGESWTTTETYYTPSKTSKLPRAFEAPNFEPKLVGVYFKVPDVWPDLNTLDDIIDRRKLFYIPRRKKF